MSREGGSFPLPSWFLLHLSCRQTSPIHLPWRIEGTALASMQRSHQPCNNLSCPQETWYNSQGSLCMCTGMEWSSKGCVHEQDCRRSPWSQDHQWDWEVLTIIILWRRRRHGSTKKVSTTGDYKCTRDTSGVLIGNPSWPSFGFLVFHAIVKSAVTLGLSCSLRLSGCNIHRGYISHPMYISH